MEEVEAKEQASGTLSARYYVTGMDCQSCVSKIEHAARKVPGVSSVKVSLAAQTMTLAADGASTQEEVERVIQQLGYKLDRLSAEDADKPRHISSSYRNALLTVVVLNFGYGLVEAVAGYFAGSKALQADALDFLGDGVITFIGFIAIGWSLAWRAKSALLQGVFLGILGAGVLASTLWRFVNAQQPEAELMGVFGAIALVINILSAVVLMPHRAGDANVRAVWLFSRNDALGNLAVVIAAGLVSLTESPLPDLIVALIIASLFLHSSWSIVKDAWLELRQIKPTYSRV